VIAEYDPEVSDGDGKLQEFEATPALWPPEINRPQVYPRKGFPTVRKITLQCY
jgi:hypothetical protein